MQWAHSNADFDEVARLSVEHGAPMVGPSLEDDEARSFVGEDNHATLGPVNHVSHHVTDLPASECWNTDALGGWSASTARSPRTGPGTSPCCTPTAAGSSL